MAPRKTLNAKNLEALGARRLAELLIEISTGDAAARRRLRLELAGAQSPRALRLRSPHREGGARWRSSAVENGKIRALCTGIPMRKYEKYGHVPTFAKQGVAECVAPCDCE